MESIYTVEEASRMLKVEISTVRYWLRNGTLRGTKLGKTWRVPESELRRIAGQEGAAPVDKDIKNLLTPAVVDYVLQAARKAARHTKTKDADRLIKALRTELCSDAVP